MKNKLLSILCLLTLLFPLKLRAQEPYAVLTGNNANEMTLIFYYDTNKGAYPAVMEVGPFYEYDECPWLANQQPITEVIFDASFADNRFIFKEFISYSINLFKSEYIFSNDSINKVSNL